MFVLIPLYQILVVLLVATLSICYGDRDKAKDVYIVYMGSLPEVEYSPTSHHLNILNEVLGESAVTNALVRSYTRSFNAFAARLSDEEQQRIASKKDVLSVFPNRNLQLQTTRSWDFMNLTETAKRNPNVESNVIIGVIDTGIWPESESFSDEGFGPPPKKWKGVCIGGNNFTCNYKLIGAQVYTSGGNTTARDKVGHGSHTASTAAGNNVLDASFYGLAKGNTRGGVSSARIAAYKVAEHLDKAELLNILAAFDDAIADGVDIITISIGMGPTPSDSDPIAIGSYHAMWEAASRIDWKFISKVVLANGKTLFGNAVNSFTLNGTKFPLVYGKAASSNCSDDDARSCDESCLNRNLVEGKILVCDSETGWIAAASSGALGAITTFSHEKAGPSGVPLPSSGLTPENYDVVKSFISSTENVQGTILKSEAIVDTTANLVAHFSSRGPNSISNVDKRSAKYSILSGTSMSRPHAAGAAAYVKTFHPNWSPSAIKSALMTIAWPMNATNEVDGEFAFGAGHINPVKALEPGLVYDASIDDYIIMLCSINISFFSRCPKDISGSAKDLNYPSMQALIESNNSFTVKFPRIVTNVGLANSTYESKVIRDSHIKVSVEPSTLSFETSGEKKSFIVTVSGKGLLASKMATASLVWSDGTHNVRSPIVVYTN
ncbi:hypothetical protein ACB092_11G163400 [Castanea dentata]